MAGIQKEIEAEPEICLARRAIERFGLRPPVDVLSLLQTYADVDFDYIPFGVDAVCIGLKTPGKKPQVIVDLAKSERRRRFTLAHELGHVLIPWHSGSLIDDIHLNEFDPDERYIEAEANRFASELLAPASWLRENFDILSDPFGSTKSISNESNISFRAAFIRVQQEAPSGLVWAEVQEGVVISSGRTKGTVASPPSRGLTHASASLFPIARHQAGIHQNVEYHFWHFDETLPAPVASAETDWRVLLDQMLEDLQLDQIADKKKFLSSLHGVIAAANSQLRTDRTPERLYSHIMQRLFSTSSYRREIDTLLEHPSIEEFVAARSAAFLSKSI